MSERVIPLTEPSLKGNEHAYLDECIRSNFVSSIGPFVERFEREFAAHVGATFAVACSSGTAALHVALRVLGVGPSDEVFVPAFTFIASANAIVYQGARPTFVDSEATTWNIDPALVRDEINQRLKDGRPVPKVIEVVHLLGHPADIEPLIDICAEHDIALVEDAAESLGATYRGGVLDGRHVGTIGRIGCFSFNGNKVITTGGGGMLVTDDPKLARHAKHLTTQARIAGLAYWHDEVGYNYRLSNLAAAMGVAQLEQIDVFLAAKRRIAQRYDEAFRDLLDITLPPLAPWANRSAWMYSIGLRDATLATTVLDNLIANQIGARPVWPPLNRMPPFADSLMVGSGAVAEETAARTVSLPTSVDLESSDQNRVIDVVRATVIGA
jgi:dTDP-4-amino-4,6-dideoxygalactose transaminase